MKTPNFALFRSMRKLRVCSPVIFVFLLKISLFSISTGQLNACSTNVVSAYAPDNEQEKAELDMEAGRFQQAAERLHNVVQQNPDNYSAKSLLAAAYAAQAEITALGLFKNASTTTTSGESSVQKFNSIFPEITSTILEFMELACTTMDAIPIDSRTTEMKVQHSLFFSAYALMQVKYFTTNAQALANITTEDALKLILTLSKAAEAGGSSPLTKTASLLSAKVEASGGDSINKVKTTLGASSP